jgi:hypothetical protein
MSEGVYKKSPANEEITIVWDFRQSCLNYPTIPTCHPVCIQLRLTGRIYVYERVGSNRADCRLATRVVQILPAVVDALPLCAIRKDCRWFSQEGGAACRRCPDITTVSYDLSETMREVSGLPVMAG